MISMLKGFCTLAILTLSIADTDTRSGEVSLAIGSFTDVFWYPGNGATGEGVTVLKLSVAKESRRTTKAEFQNVRLISKSITGNDPTYCAKYSDKELICCNSLAVSEGDGGPKDGTVTIFPLSGDDSGYAYPVGSEAPVHVAVLDQNLVLTAEFNGGSVTSIDPTAEDRSSTRRLQAPVGPQSLLAGVSTEPPQGGSEATQPPPEQPEVAKSAPSLRKYVDDLGTPMRRGEEFIDTPLRGSQRQATPPKEKPTPKELITEEKDEPEPEPVPEEEQTPPPDPPPPDPSSGPVKGVFEAPKSDADGDGFPQDAPRMHQVVKIGSNRVLVPDLGSDMLRVLTIGPDGDLSQTSQVQLDPGDGPRHAVVSSSGGIYVVCQLSLRILHLSFTCQGSGIPGQLRLCDATDILEASERSDGDNGAAIRLSPDHRFLYVTVRRENGPGLIAGFRMNYLGELARRVGVWETGGKEPRDFDIVTIPGIPDEDYVVVANELSNEVCVFERRQGSGKLHTTPLATVSVGSPTSILVL